MLASKPMDLHLNELSRQLTRDKGSNWGPPVDIYAPSETFYKGTRKRGSSFVTPVVSVMPSLLLDKYPRSSNETATGQTVLAMYLSKSAKRT
mmetsp:Transcript_61969/g.71056  ORF Transcript_61969/g.71056 Transcript_61969/m.71056 type:complete len:92 (-) Transcript_61969:328-603(-)